VLASKVGGDPLQLLQAPGDLDWSGCNLDVNDVRALAGLCVRPPPFNKQVQATTLKLSRTSRGILIGTLVGRAETVDLRNRGLSTLECTLISVLLKFTRALTVTNLLSNQLDAEATTMLAKVAKQKGISLCGIRRDQTTADFRNKGLKLSDTILLASDLSQAVVTGALTSVDLRGNKLGDKGWGAIFAAICGNKDSKIMSLDASSENIGSAGVKLIAEALRTSVTGALTVTNLLGNWFDAESAKMLAEVAKQKGISLCGILRDQTTTNFSNQNLKLPDAILLASDLSKAVVTGGLTVANLLGNQLDAESAKMLAKVAKQKGISLCGIQRNQTTADFSKQSLNPPDAMLLASDLSQTVVTGALTEVRWPSVFGPQIVTCSELTACALRIQVNLDGYGLPIKKLKGIEPVESLDLSNKRLGVASAIVIASLIGVNGALTSIDLSSNQLTNYSKNMMGIKELAAALRANGALTNLK
jgi:hypothetical protein